MSDNKYVSMMHHAEDVCRTLAIDNAIWPGIAAENIIEAADWQAAAEAFEALVEALQANTDLLRELYGERITIDQLKAQITSNEEALKKAGVE